ncbi:MAG: EAL domain-containing protein [Gammaproteobacteria bacterium]|nr:EAL domain-containing protein [Gammaproteobacteria bacterium]
MLAAFLLIGAAGLFLSSWDGGAGKYASHSNVHVELKDLEARLDRDVLEVTSFLLIQYDDLSNTVKQLHAARIRQMALIEEYGETNNHRLKDTAGKYWQALEEKIQLIEKIKYQAAFVRNSTSYLPTVAEELKKNKNSSYLQLLELLNQLYHYNILPSSTALDSIRYQLNELELLADPVTDQQLLLDNILFHIHANLIGLSRLSELEQRYLAINSSQRFEQLHGVFEQLRESELLYSQWVSVGLALVIALLLAGLLLLLNRIEQARFEVETAWKRLHDGIDSLSEAFALFDTHGRLVLHNKKFKTFYPWLLERNLEGVSQQELEQTFLENTVRLDTSGIRIEEFVKRGEFLEKLENGAWYLASNSPTSEGGMVCVRTDVTEAKNAEYELRKLSSAMYQSPASIIITNTGGIIEYANPKAAEVSGYTLDELIGKNPKMLKSDDKSSHDYKLMWDTISAGNEWRGEFHNKRKDGTFFWEAASISPLRDETGTITHYIAVKEDITARKHTEELMRMNAMVFETTTEGIMITDIEGRVKSVNPAFSKITGYTSDEIVGLDSKILNSGRHDEQFFHEMWQELANKGQWSAEIWNKKKDGTIFPMWLSLAAIQDASGHVSEYVAVFTDISKRKEDEEKIRYQANYDALTHLPNRMLFTDRLSKSIEFAQRNNKLLALLFLDLDQFKVVNDTLGHAVGDYILQMAAKRLSDCVRTSDTVARFGGDEFVILLVDIADADDAALVANKVISELSRSFFHEEREIFIGASVGISLFPNDSDQPDQLLLNADMAMYKAKESGRGVYHFFTEAMQQQVTERQHLGQDLRLALERCELELYYQPVVDIKEERIRGAEALIRWHHPKMGLVPPDRFIPLAEELGLIDSIGEWVIYTACKQARAWNDSGLQGLEIAVNISSRQLDLGLTADDITRILNHTGLPASSLIIEVTESLLMDDVAESSQWLDSVRAGGISLSIDDFGTGYSSLSYLKRFSMDVLKIDRAFVADLPGDKDDVLLVEAIIAMAKSLNLKLVAEGIETTEQIEFMVNADCDYLQGYYFSKPLPAEQFYEWIHTFQWDSIN